MLNTNALAGQGARLVGRQIQRCFQQGPGVRVARALDHGLRVSFFHHLTGLHDHGPMGQRAPLSDRGR